MLVSNYFIVKKSGKARARNIREIPASISQYLKTTSMQKRLGIRWAMDRRLKRNHLKAAAVQLWQRKLVFLLGHLQTYQQA
jgi:hypothetical protein